MSLFSSKYIDEGFTEELQRELLLPRHALHASISNIFANIGLKCYVEVLLHTYRQVILSAAYIKLGEYIVELNKLIDDLKNGGGLGRSKAAADLGKMGNIKAVKALIEAMEDSNMGVRSNAVFSLAELGAKEAAPGIMSLLINDPEYWVRKSAAKALGMLEVEAAVNPLSIALDDNSPIVRENALRSLEQIGSSEAKKVLQEALSKEDKEV